MAFSVYIQSTELNILLSQTTYKVCYGHCMAQDDDFIIGGRKAKKSSSQGTPRTANNRGGTSQPIVKLGTLSGGSMSFTKRLAKDMAIAKRSSGRRSYAKPSKPRTGRFNARGRGRSALAAGIGPNRSWQDLVTLTCGFRV